MSSLCKMIDQIDDKKTSHSEYFSTPDLIGVRQNQISNRMHGTYDRIASLKYLQRVSNMRYEMKS